MIVVAVTGTLIEGELMGLHGISPIVRFAWCFLASLQAYNPKSFSVCEKDKHPTELAIFCSTSLLIYRVYIDMRIDQKPLVKDLVKDDH